STPQLPNTPVRGSHGPCKKDDAPTNVPRHISGGLDMAIARAVAYAPYADLIWCETSEPDLDEAARFAEGVHEHHPGKLLAYNCSPSFKWKAKLDDAAIARCRDELGATGCEVQF